MSTSQYEVVDDPEAPTLDDAHLTQRFLYLEGHINTFLTGMAQQIKTTFEKQNNYVEAVDAKLVILNNALESRLREIEDKLGIKFAGRSDDRKGKTKDGSLTPQACYDAVPNRKSGQGDQPAAVK